MARHGENIRKRKDGRWEGRYLSYSEKKERNLYHSVYGKTYEETREKLLLKKIQLKEMAAEGKPEGKGISIAKDKEIRTAGDIEKERESKEDGKLVEKNGEEAAIASSCGREVNRGKGDDKYIGSKQDVEYIGSKQDAEYVGRKQDVEYVGSKQDAEYVGNRKDVKYVSDRNEDNGNKNNNGITEEVSFGTAAEEWLERIRFNKKPSTYIKYRTIYRNYLEKLFQSMEISRITNQIVQERISDPLSESIGKSVYCVLNQILKYASGKYTLRLMLLKRPVSYIPKKTVETFSRKEQSKLLSVLYQEMDSFKTAVLLCLHTGLRLGELCSLKWEDIDMENQLILVSRTVQRLHVEGYATKTILLETAPKSTYSRREIPLSSAAFALLSQFGEGDKKEYVFGGDKPVEPRTMQNHFKQILKKAGISHKNFHALRHTFSTNCIEGGTDVKSLSEILGHSDVQITLNRYVHPSMDTKRRHLDTLSGFYGQICEYIYGQIHGQFCGKPYGQAS